MKSFLTIALLSITNFGFSQNNVELVDYKEIYKNSNDSLMQFFMSSKGDNYGILQLIMNKEDIKKVSPEGLNNLHYACRFGHAETAKLLLNVGIDVNVTSLHRRMVPLHFAILSGNKNLLIELIKYGANVNAQDTEGLTPLHYAVLMNDTNMLKILIDAKANIHLKASNELNPILYSVLMNKKQTIFYLLQNVKVDINQTTSKGFSLLSLAVYYSDIETCDFLLKKGSSKNIKLTDGRSLIDIANERKDEKMTKYIKKL